MKFWAGWAVECQMQNGDVCYLTAYPNRVEPGCWPSQSIAEAFADHLLKFPNVLSVTIVEWTAEDHKRAVNRYKWSEEIHPYTGHPVPCSCSGCGSYYVD